MSVSVYLWVEKSKQGGYIRRAIKDLVRSGRRRECGPRRMQCEDSAARRLKRLGSQSLVAPTTYVLPPILPLNAEQAYRRAREANQISTRTLRMETLRIQLGIGLPNMA